MINGGTALPRARFETGGPLGFCGGLWRVDIGHCHAS
jgi:hypothetical protein